MTPSADYNLIAYFTKSALTPSLSPHINNLQEPKPTLFGRIENFLLHVVDYYNYYYYTFPECDKIVASSFKNLPPLTKLAQRSILTMFNYDAAVDGILIFYETRTVALYHFPI